MVVEGEGGLTAIYDAKKMLLSASFVFIIRNIPLAAALTTVNYR